MKVILIIYFIFIIKERRKTLGSFTDQKPRYATEKEINFNWGDAPKGKKFRCYLCGYRFKVGDYWRWVYSHRFINFLVCEKCDGEDVVERWISANEEAKERFWWLWERQFEN